VLVETPVLGRDERLLYVLRNVRQRNIHPPDDRETPDQPAISIENSSALGRAERADFRSRGTAGEATAEEPGVKHENGR
jgi:hypothetical protein